MKSPALAAALAVLICPAATAWAGSGDQTVEGGGNLPHTNIIIKPPKPPHHYEDTDRSGLFALYTGAFGSSAAAQSKAIGDPCPAILVQGLPSGLSPAWGSTATDCLATGTLAPANGVKDVTRTAPTSSTYSLSTGAAR